MDAGAQLESVARVMTHQVIAGDAIGEDLALALVKVIDAATTRIETARANVDIKF